MAKNMMTEKQSRRNLIRSILVFLLVGMLTIGFLAFLYNGVGALDGWTYVLGAIALFVFYALVGENLIQRINSPQPRIANRLRYFVYILYFPIAFLIYLFTFPLTINLTYFPGRATTLLAQFTSVADIVIFLVIGYSLFRWHRSLIEIARQRDGQ